MEYLKQKIDLLKYEVIDEISKIEYYEFKNGCEPFVEYNGILHELSSIKNGLLVFYNENIKPVRPVMINQNDLFTIVSLINL